MVSSAWAQDPDWLQAGDTWDASTSTLTVNNNPGKDAYTDNTEIQHLVFADNVTFENLSAVTILAQTPPTLGRNVFTDIAIAEDLRIYVPRESVDAYKTAYPDLADIIKPIMEGTGIQSVHSSESIVHSEADAWYTLDGCRIQGKPLQKGLYINNGNKIIIK